MAENCAECAGFAAWLDIIPVNPNILAIPDGNSSFKVVLKEYWSKPQQRNTLLQWEENENTSF